jgi:hypothetical protein
MKPIEVIIMVIVVLAVANLLTGLAFTMAWLFL